MQNQFSDWRKFVPHLGPLYSAAAPQLHPAQEASTRYTTSCSSHHDSYWITIAIATPQSLRHYWTFLSSTSPKRAGIPSFISNSLVSPSYYRQQLLSYQVGFVGVSLSGQVNPCCGCTTMHTATLHSNTWGIDGVHCIRHLSHLLLFYIVTLSCSVFLSLC